MYCGVPITAPKPVSIVCSVSVPPVALATPKSITFTTGLSSYKAISTFDGLMSRWMIPFWWACWIAWHTGTNSSSRSFGVSLWWSQYSVIGTPFTSSITKYGRPSWSPPSSTLAMFGWSISASACRSASNRASTCFESIPALISLTATNRLTGSVCLARQTDPMPPSPIASTSVYLPAMTTPACSSVPEGSAFSPSVAERSWVRSNPG